MFYDLLQRNHKVCRIELNDDYEFAGISEIYDSNRIPLGTNKAQYDSPGKEIDSEKFKIWWKSRFVPSDRAFLRKVFEKLKIKSVDELISRTHCASLSDQYWTQKADGNSRWEDVNFYTNSFDDSVGTVLLLNADRDFSEKSLDTPDFTTDGQLPKKWLIKDKIRYLVKGTESVFQQEPFNEWLASDICRKLNLSHVEYDVLNSEDKDGEKEYFSRCANFTDETKEFVPAYFVVNSFKKSNSDSDFNHFLKCSAKLGIKNVETDVTNMLLVDFLMSNTDRHYRNFGFLRNSETLEWLGFAPIFDTERSMFLSKATVKNRAPVDSPAKPFKDNHAQQFNLLSNEILKKLTLENLKNSGERFAQILKENVYMPEERIESLANCLDERISLAQSLIKENRKIKITKSRHQREIDRFNSLSSIVIS